jgi:RNA polymerase sigma-70 factor (ECF subfamily)
VNELSQEEKWLGRLRRGKTEALADLFEHYRSQLRLMVQLRIGDQLAARLDASDVLQDTFVDASKKVEAYVNDPRVSCFVWLRRLTSDRLIALQRKHLGAKLRSVNRELRLPETSSEMLAKGLVKDSSPSANMATAEVREHVQRALMRLPAADREVILMRNIEGLSNNLVAEVLGVSVSAATMRHGRALIRLRDLLNSDSNNRGDLS